jgi:inner membrane protein
MFFAHLPAGYISSKLLLPRFALPGAASRPFMLAGMVGAIAPDLDMIYFYLADHRQYQHHTYLPHLPIVWIGLLIASAIWLYTGRFKNNASLAIIFSLNGLIHMFLDTIVGGIWWFAPFIDKPFRFFNAPALHKPWWLNFMLHWSFALELAIVAWAFYLWRSSPDSIN